MINDESLLHLLERISRLEHEIEHLRTLEFIQHNDIVIAQYRTSAGQSIPSTGVTIVDFDAKVTDSHDAVTTGASWKFTAPVGGWYYVHSVTLYTQTTTWAETEFGSMRLYKNGSGSFNMDRHWGQDSSGLAQFKPVFGTAFIGLSKNDFIDVRVENLSGGALTLQADANWNYINIFWIK